MGLIAFLFGCSQPDTAATDIRPTGMSKDDIRRAALRIVYPLPACNKSWSGGTVKSCDDALVLVAERRMEFKNFEPPWMRAAIMHWFDYAEREIREALEDCITGKSRAELDAYRKRSDEERIRAQEVLKSIGR